MEANETREAEPAMQDIRILVAEDNILVQFLLKTYFIIFNCRFDIVNDGKQVIEKLRQQSYEIILMDLIMPEMDGFEATTCIRKEMRLQIPIIAMTADVNNQIIEKCWLWGMNDYLLKPVDENILRSKIIDQLLKVKSGSNSIAVH